MWWPLILPALLALFALFVWHAMRNEDMDNIHY